MGFVVWFINLIRSWNPLPVRAGGFLVEPKHSMAFFRL